MPSKHSGRRCVVAGCSNVARDGVSLHTFPLNDAVVCNAWSRFVKLTRADWKQPSKHSAICSDHFERNCFDARCALMSEFGLSSKRRLVPGAIPSVYQPKPPTPSSCTKRQSLNDAFLASPEKKPRSAFAKREIARITEEYSSVAHAACDSTHLPDVDLEEVANKENEDPARLCKPSTMSVKIQTTKVAKSTRSYSVQVRIRAKEKGTQVDIQPRIRSIGIQCDPSNFEAPADQVPDKYIVPRSRVHVTEFEDTCMNDSSDYQEESSDQDSNTSSYQPSSSDSSDHDLSIDSDNESSTVKGPLGERKFIVTESKLLQLFQKCVFCNSPANGEVKQIVGSLVKIETECAFCGKVYKWNSQDLVGSIPSGNLCMSLGILSAGLNSAKGLRVFSFMNVCHISRQTFMLHQKHYLYPSIMSVWKNYQDEYSTRARNNRSQLHIGGDGRADTPGHSAKYGSYSILDLREGKVIDVQLVQSNEVKSSNHMEKEGLVRGIAWIESEGLQVGSIVTDRHLQIQKWIRENMASTKHYYDVWHVAKGLKKKLLAISKKKDCEVITPWIKSITNHLYWVAASTPDGSADIMWAKWKSICNHIQDIHEGHSEMFPACMHGALERRKKWLVPSSKPCEFVCDILLSWQMKRDVSKLSPHYQTSQIEAFHSTINHFAPKMFGFSFHGMQCRLILAAQHYNENSGKQQAVKKDGEMQINVVYPKYKAGDYTVRYRTVQSTYRYVKDITQEVSHRAEQNKMRCSTGNHGTPVPPPLCAEFYHPKKNEAVARMKSRFCMETSV